MHSHQPNYNITISYQLAYQLKTFYPHNTFTPRQPAYSSSLSSFNCADQKLFHRLRFRTDIYLLACFQIHGILYRHLRASTSIFTFKCLLKTRSDFFKFRPLSLCTIPHSRLSLNTTFFEWGRFKCACFIPPIFLLHTLWDLLRKSTLPVKQTRNIISFRKPTFYRQKTMY